MVRLDAETKQITHAIRMAACNAETILARALDGHYARARDEAYALIREALATSGDIHPGPGQLLIRLDPLTAPRRTQAMAALCDQLNQAGCTYPGTDLTLRYEVKPHPGPVIPYREAAAIILLSAAWAASLMGIHYHLSMWVESFCVLTIVPTVLYPAIIAIATSRRIRSQGIARIQRRAPAKNSVFA